MTLRAVSTPSPGHKIGIEPSGTVFGEAIAAPADWTNQTDRVEHPVTQRIAACTLLSAVSFLDEAPDAQQPLEEWKGCEQA